MHFSSNKVIFSKSWDENKWIGKCIEKRIAVQLKLHCGVDISGLQCKLIYTAVQIFAD